MSNKFAAITANLLSRKGDALPSAMAKTSIDWHAPLPILDQPPPPRFANGYHHPAADHHGAHDDDHPHLRKIQVGLSDGEHEKLRIVSARVEKSRQQVVRDALALYFEKLGHDYKEQCRCLSAATPCGRACAPG